MATLIGSALAWFILFLIVLALAIWFLSWLLFPEYEPVAVGKSLEGLTDMDPVMAGKLASFGIRSDRELMRLTPRGQQELESQLGLHKGEYDRWRREILSCWRGQFLPAEFRDVDAIVPDPELGGIYPRRPAETDEFTKIQGIEKITASRMNNAGIYTFEQLRLMAPEQQACFKQRFNLTGFDFDEVPSYGVTAQWLEFQKTGQNTDKSDSASSSADSAQSIHESNLTPSTIRAAEKSESSGGSPESKAKPSELEGTPTTVDLASAATSPQPEMAKAGKPSRQFASVDERLSNQLAAQGITSDQDLIRALPERLQELEARLGLRAGQLVDSQGTLLDEWRRKYIPEKFHGIKELIPDPELGAVFATRPRASDDLTRIAGVDQLGAEKLNQAGIHTFEQLRSLSSEQEACLRSRFNLPDFAVDRVPTFGVTAQWLASFGATGNVEGAPRTKVSKGIQPSRETKVAASPAASGNEPAQVDVSTDEGSQSGHEKGTIPKSISDPEFGRVYTSAPPHRDDLTSIQGVNPDVADKLNAAGIYTVDQIRSLSPQQRESFVLRFDLPEFDFGQWSSAALATSGTVPKPCLEPPVSKETRATSLTSTSDPGQRYSSGYASKEHAIKVTGFAAASGALAANPSDETSGWSGIEAETPKSTTPLIVSSGEYASAVPADPTALRDERTGFHFHSATSRPEEVDDLTRLPEIGSDLADKLNSAGIYTFSQLANLSLSEQTTLRTEFGLHGTKFPEWRRLIFAWSRGIQTSFDVQSDVQERENWLHTVRLSEMVPGVFDGQQLVAYPEQVVFRNSDPKSWGTDFVAPDRSNLSLGAESIRSDINYVRLRRLDTRDSVVAAVTKPSLFTPFSEGRSGWNGLCESYFGARHLGISSSQVPREAEVKLGMGGWGFGHLGSERGAGEQAFCWAGRVIPPTSFEISVGRIGHSSGTVIFRGDSPEGWNSERTQSAIQSLAHRINFVRLQRGDTGEAVVVPVDRTALTRRSDQLRSGWNGLCDHFSGGHHLGIYHADADQEVELVYGIGGWGFGHLYGHDNRQAYAWGGRSIPKTTFEITVYEHLPGYFRHEILDP